MRRGATHLNPTSEYMFSAWRRTAPGDIFYCYK